MWHLDTCVIIALARGEQRDDSDETRGLNRLATILSGKRRGDATELMASSITYFECGPTSIDDHDERQEVAKTVEGWLDDVRQLLTMGSVTPEVGSLARELKHNFKDVEKTITQGVRMGAADWIQLASAIHRECDKLLTFDSRMIELGNHSDFDRDILIQNPSELVEAGPIFNK